MNPVGSPVDLASTRHALQPLRPELCVRSGRSGGVSKHYPFLFVQLKENKALPQLLSRHLLLSFDAVFVRLPQTNVKAYHAKLVKDFHGVLKEFQKAQRICLDRESMYRPHEEESNKTRYGDCSAMRTPTLDLELTPHIHMHND
eukprot:96040-Prorocentrum_minimum.AAC.3